MIAIISYLLHHYSLLHPVIGLCKPFPGTHICVSTHHIVIIKP